MLPAVLPLYLFTVVFVLCPILYIVAISFFTRNAVWGFNLKFTFDNYLRMFRPQYLKVLVQSFGLAFFTTLLTLAIGYPFGYFMARLRRRARVILLLLVIVPFWTNSLVRLYGWMTLMGYDGIINTVLLKLHVISSPLKLLYTYGAVLVGMLYCLLPFMILAVYSSVEKMDWSVVEAARDLGANRLTAFLTVTLRATLPGLLSGCILVFVPSIGLFFISDLMGGAKYMLVGNLIKDELLVSRDWPFGAALSVVMLAITLLVIGICRKVAGSRDLGVF